MFSFALLSLSFVVAGVLGAPLGTDETTLPRRAATLYTSCTVPNTVALTFVSKLSPSLCSQQLDFFH